MSWTLLKSDDEWEDYRLDTAKKLQVMPERIKWGSGPDDYPALVTTLMPPRPAGAEPVAYSAFVYLADAEELMKAAGRTVSDPDSPKSPNQAQFNRWVAAQMLTVTKFLIDTGIAKEAAYEETLLHFLEVVDKETAARADEIRNSTLTASQLAGLETLKPESQK